MLLSSCNSQPDIKVTYLDSPNGRVRLELRDWGDGKELYLSSNTSSTRKPRLLLQTNVCSNVSAGWSSKGNVVVAFEDLEATHFDTHSHGEHDGVGVVLCKSGHSGCDAPALKFATINACE